VFSISQPSKRARIDQESEIEALREKNQALEEEVLALKEEIAALKAKLE
jgi:cell division protein FtsB